MVDWINNKSTMGWINYGLSQELIHGLRKPKAASM